MTVHRETLTQYITFKRGGERGVYTGTLVLCCLAIMTSCIDASVRIVTKSPKVGPLLIFSNSLIIKKAMRANYRYPTYIEKIREYCK